MDFHESIGTISHTNPRAQKAFYIRSAYRNEAAFLLDTLRRTPDALQDVNRPKRLIDTDARVSDNYLRVVSETVAMMYEPRYKDLPTGQVADLIIGEIRESFRSVFNELNLEGPGDPLLNGTFYLTKGTAKHYAYQNFSGGEKAVFDLLLYLIVKRKYYDDTVFCIDEPELHISPNVHGVVLGELLRLLPGYSSQLWIATHSAGMLKRAFEIYQTNPNDVVFLDFHEIDFDKPQIMTPAKVTRTLWRRALSVAIHDLSDLVAPKQIVMCEGRALGTPGRERKQEFDARIYRIIFSVTHPDTEFISIGGCQEMRELSILTANLERLFPSLQIIKISDHDNLSPDEVADLPHGLKVLSRYSIENYLWSDEIILKMFKAQAPHLDANIVISMKRGSSE